MSRSYRLHRFPTARPRYITRSGPLNSLRCEAPCSLSPVLRGEGWGEGTNASTWERYDIATHRPLTLPSPLSTGERVLIRFLPVSDHLQDLQFHNQSRIKIDALLEDAGQSVLTQRDDPSFFDN